MTQSPQNMPARPVVSTFDVYCGYVVTQGHNALQYVVMWERAMRAIAVASLAMLAALWLSPDSAVGPQVVLLKLVLSAVLGGLAVLLLMASRARPQYESQVDLIHCELRQVIRAASGIERVMMRVPFARVAGLYVSVNRTLPQASALYLEIDEAPAPVLLAIGDAETLGQVHRRLSNDLAKARNLTIQHPIAADGPTREGAIQVA